MKKNLNVQEIQNSKWPKLFETVFGDNLVSAFLHGNCLMEGFSALEEPWHISFILKDNSQKEILKLQAYSKAAFRDNITFGYFFSPAEIVKTLSIFPLEYLHIANKNIPLCGIQPFAGFAPDKSALKHECEQELQGFLIHLRKNLVNTTSVKKTAAVLGQSKEELMSTLYGLYYLKTDVYPESLQQVKDFFPTLFQKSLDADLIDGIKEILASF